MSATEELRRLLDERGVEYYPKASDETVFITGTEHVHVQDDLIDGCLELFTRPITPEQAIEATLGRGECRDVNEVDNDFTCSECGASMFTMIEGCWTMIGRSGLFKDVIEHPRYCPNCGRKVVE